MRSRSSDIQRHATGLSNEAASLAPNKAAVAINVGLNVECVPYCSRAALPILGGWSTFGMPFLFKSIKDHQFCVLYESCSSIVYPSRTHVFHNWCWCRTHIKRCSTLAQ